MLECEVIKEGKLEISQEGKGSLRISVGGNYSSRIEPQ